MELSTISQSTTPVSTANEVDANIAVVDQATLDKAGNYISVINERIKVIVQHYKPLKDSAYKAHKSVTQQEKDDIAPLQTAVARLKRNISDYLAQEREKARERERLLIEEQRQAKERAKRDMETALALQQEAMEQGDTATAKEMSAEWSKSANVLVAETQTIAVETPKSSTMTFVDSYEVLVVDNQLVPTHCYGLEIRPVDTSLIKKYAKEWYNSGVGISGIAITKTQTVRSK